jgi:biofilm PGA synthesis lipoprotein PgaB
MRRLQLGGALGFGYYPDDFLRDHPAYATVRPALSLQADLE